MIIFLKIGRNSKPMIIIFLSTFIDEREGRQEKIGPEGGINLSQTQIYMYTVSGSNNVKTF